MRGGHAVLPLKYVNSYIKELSFQKKCTPKDCFAIFTKGAAFMLSYLLP